MGDWELIYEGKQKTRREYDSIQATREVETTYSGTLGVELGDIEASLG
ncbi:hypothetical protein [Bacillus solimangrovi]|nr:hypothetical protein [Bacillus solimangrovi]